MGRKRLISSNVFPYHITARVNNREVFPIPLDIVWNLMSSEWFSLQILYKFEIHAFVLMPNHFHLLASTPEEGLGKIMNVFMSVVSKRINDLSGKTGHVFGGPYYWSLITSTRYYGHALKYVYRNPVRACLSHTVEEYPYSTARGIIGYSPLILPLSFTQCGLEANIPDPNRHFEWLDWLNHPFPSEAEDLIREALRKREIHELKSPTSRRPIELLKKLL